MKIYEVYSKNIINNIWLKKKRVGYENAINTLNSRIQHKGYEQARIEIEELIRLTSDIDWFIEKASSLDKNTQKITI